ncbi:metal-dependent transcriptional regulator [Methanobrevibacter curvatus]|uniref:Iron-dependent repressor IdeR n=1 Tax=Methanobrevibacter curvatus TaxID=49547 RepID=A0A165YX36_9EURY|nr:metal-dependent transcriptional regulator [Methanobrevibacter curvatus]KZX09972.1 iron-dependent repressor IdeR [Methanobrevibacter curvatus]
MSKELSENIEEYLEVLYKYGDIDTYVSTTKISKSLKIAPGSVTQMLKKLEKEGYIHYAPYKGAMLSNDGFKIAKKITRKHRILERFLRDVLNIKDENIHQQACDMEHSLSDEAERAMCHILEQPTICPDEKIIPVCDFDFKTCQECITNESSDINEIGMRTNNLISLGQLHLNETAEVSFIRGNDDILKGLISKGIAIGTKIMLSESIDENDLNVEVNDSKIKLPKNLSNNIFVNVLN